MTQVRAPLDVRAIAVDAPRTGEVLVRMAASGVCHSDLHTLDGSHPYPLPVVLGHEGAGVVEAVGGGRGQRAAGRPRDAVVGAPTAVAAACACAGRPNLCEDLAWSDAGHVMDGTVRFTRRRGARPPLRAVEHSPACRSCPRSRASRWPATWRSRELALMGCAVMTGVRRGVQHRRRGARRPRRGDRLRRRRAQRRPGRGDRGSDGDRRRRRVRAARSSWPARSARPRPSVRTGAATAAARSGRSTARSRRSAGARRSSWRWP